MTPALDDAFAEADEAETRDAPRLDSRVTAAETEGAGGPPEAETKDATRASSDRETARAFPDENLSRRLVVAEVTAHYARRKADCVRRTGRVPARVRRPRATWNGGAPGLCRLAAPAEPGRDAAECFLSRTYTEGFGAPVAFAAYPSADVLCRACGDVAWDPVRFPGREEASGTRPSAAPDASDLWCRDCLVADGVAGERDAEALPVDETVTARVALARVLCRHALVCERVDASATASGPESSEVRWRMDRVSRGCSDSGRLCDREQIERDCPRAVRVCGLPGDANPGDACVARVRAGDFEAHAASCAFRLVPCARRHLGCARAVRFKHAEQHFRLCEHRPFACPNRPRCAWRGLRRDVEVHLENECAWEVVPCGLVDDDPDGALAGSRETEDARAERKLERRARSERCEVRLVRCKLAAHRAVCRFRRATCRHCGAPRAVRRLAQHEAECAFSRFTCSRCGAEGIPSDARRTHDERVCPELEITCEFARYGCSRPRLPRREYAEHARTRLHEHLELLLRRDANAPLPERTEDGDPYPALSETSREERATETNDTHGALGAPSADGFMALVTRHELTRGDARRVAAVAVAAADGVATEAQTLAAALGDAADATTSARELLASQIARAKAQFQTRCTEALQTIAEGEKTVEAHATACLSASGSARLAAATALADADALDAAKTRAARETSALVDAASDASRKLEGSFVTLLAAAAPALDVQAEMEARVAAAGAAARARVARLEWTSADAAIVAWEKIGDARESFAKKLVARDVDHRALLLKVEAFERGRFVSAAEDLAMRKRARETGGSHPSLISGEPGEEAPADGDGDASAPPAPTTPRGAGAEPAEARS